MSETKIRILAIVGSLQSRSATRVVVKGAVERFEAAGCEVDLLDLAVEPLALFNPETTKKAPDHRALQKRVEHADVILLGTPDYHGSVSGAAKNFLDHFWHEFSGKLFATIVASHEKGLTVTDHLRTVARQCYAWSLPYGLSFTDGVDVKEGQIVSDTFVKRLDMFVRDTHVYGGLLAGQRHRDLEGTDNCFMGRHRPKA
jgi:FMN reductase